MLVVRACLHSFPDRAIRRILMAYRPSQVRHTTWGRVSVPPLATEDEPHYINRLENLPCHRGVRQRQVNVWMSGYAPLPDEIDLQHSKEMHRGGVAGVP